MKFQKSENLEKIIKLEIFFRKCLPTLENINDLREKTDKNSDASLSHLRRKIWCFT